MRANERENRSVVKVLALLCLLAPAGDLSAQALALPGLRSGAAPWTNGVAGLTERLKAIGLPAMPSEAFAQHIHQHLVITLLGKNITVPAEIGINLVERYISPLHTHDTLGVIHIESATLDKFTLGQFFDVWGVRFTGRCVGGYCNRAGDSLRVTVNGARVPGDPRSVVLVDGQ